MDVLRTVGSRILRALRRARWPILSVESHALPQSSGKLGPRAALVVTIDAPYGPTVVVCTHLDHRFDHSADRVTQVRAIAELVAQVREEPESSFPVLLAGDFNAVPDSDEVRALTGRTTPPVPGLIFQDCWELVGEGPGRMAGRKHQVVVHRVGCFRVRSPLPSLCKPCGSDDSV